VDTWRVVGLRGTGSDTYTLADLFVPEDHTIERSVRAKRHEGGLLYAFSSSNLYSAGFAGVALGIAGAVFDAFLELAGGKVPRGAERTLRENNVIQAQVAQARAKIATARAFLLRSLDDIWHRAEVSGQLSLADNTTIRLAS